MKEFLLKSLSSIGISVSIALIAGNIHSPGFCPLLWVVPACYLVFLSFTATFIALFLKGKARTVLFWGANCFGFLMAIYFSVNQILGFKDCPVFIGIPLCFVSFLAFGLLMVLQKFLSDTK